MKAFCLLFLAVFLVVSVLGMPADCKNWPEGRKERPDSKALCYIFTPWPFYHTCKGCPDRDGDGVADRFDKCPDTPCCATVDEYGCPSDSDGDGVYDGIDRCPNTPAGTEVDKNGCPVKTSEAEAAFLNTGLIRASNILFELEKANLKPESKEILNEIGNILVQWPDLEIEIGGHTDSAGDEAFNKKLSEERAAAVFEYLKTNFTELDPKNFTVKGYGESKPIDSNDTAEGRAKNRRVEFKCLNEEELRKEVDRRRQ